MRRRNLQRALAGIAAMGAIAGGSAALAATSGQLTLSGTVQQILTITVTPAAAASGLDLTGSVSQLKVVTRPTGRVSSAQRLSRMTTWGSAFCVMRSRCRFPVLPGRSFRVAPGRRWVATATMPTSATMARRRTSTRPPITLRH